MTDQEELEQALKFAERWQEVRTDESHGIAGKNFGMLSRALLKLRAFPPEEVTKLEGKDFIDARLDWLHKRGRNTDLPYPTRDELAAFYDGWHAARSPQVHNPGEAVKRLTAKEQEELLLAVGGLLTNAEDPTKVTTNTAMCGRYELQNVHEVWKRCWGKATAVKHSEPQGERS